ncbi:DUF6250 domain-containing protein [Pricia sp.]|uniref:DUF6250 domain-containing protein n=1 Tax=Pricia sp. TaxID=2268138 RepID=UPI0035941B5A
MQKVSARITSSAMIGMCYFSLVLISVQCKPQKNGIKNEVQAVTLLHKDNFNSGMSDWVVEQMPGGTVQVSNAAMEIIDVAGCTVWYTKKLIAPLIIEYDAVVLDRGGPKDRVSDLNCFWLASDLEHPENFFATSENRNGKFENYDRLQLYYVGLGGHHNTKTRFRRYTGTGKKPLLSEHDLSDPKYLIESNMVNHIKISVSEGIVQYYRNDQLIFDFYDEKPYASGYFGIRTVHNHMAIDNFKVFSLKADD